MKDEHIPLVIFGSVGGLIALGILATRPMFAAQVRLVNAMADGIEQGKITHITSTPMGMSMAMNAQKSRANPRKKKSKTRKNPAVSPILF